MEGMQVFIWTEMTGRVDVTERTRDWRFRSRHPGGWWDAELSLDAPYRDLWRLVDAWPGGTLEFWAGERVWYGYLSRANLAGATMRLQAVGEYLNDGAELWRVFSDPEVRNWKPGDVPDGFAADNNNRVYVEAGGTFVTGDEVTMEYPETGVELGAGIVQVTAYVEAQFTSGSWVAEIRTDTGTVLWSSAVNVATDVDLTVSDADGLVAALRATADGDGASSLRLLDVLVRTVADPTNKTIAAELISERGWTAVISGEAGVEVDRALYQKATIRSALEGMAALGDGATGWLFTVYDGVAELRPWADDDPEWRLDPQDMQGFGLEWQRDRIINAVRAELPDGWRSAWLTDDDSIEYFGLRNEETLRLERTTQAEATRLAQIHLEDNSWPMAALSLEVGARLHRPDGAALAAWFVRAGDVVVLRDLVPDRDVTIRAAEVEVSPSGVRITPAGVDDRLETLLAAQARRVEKVERESRIDGTGVAAVSGGGTQTTWVLVQHDEPTVPFVGLVWVEI